MDWHIASGPDGLQGVITCDHPATRYVLDGTRPHIIRPRRAKALRFEAGGEVVFAAYARHPAQGRIHSSRGHCVWGAEREFHP
ncbi:hypothetical protein ACR6C2_07560 [Streptomyces sp. INA 01156]